MPPEPTDEELMTLYQRGDESAFRRLYGRYEGRVYGYLYQRLGNTEAARDVFQLSFLKLHRSRDRFDNSYPFAPWLFTVVRTTMLDWLKARRDIPADLGEIAAPEREAAPETVDLSALPASQRSAVELRYLEELSFEAIAERLQTSPANVRQLVSRGVRNLRGLLKGGPK